MKADEDERVNEEERESQTADSLHARMEGITVAFPENGVVANDSVDLSIRRGEVHAIVGENGSGKSTLMHVLSGYVPKDAGSIFIDGEQVEIQTPKQALARGIGMIHQHVRLVRLMRVWENVVLGAEPTGRAWIVKRDAALRSLRGLAEEYRLNIDPERYVGELSAEGMQTVALLGALYHDARLVILDEPTSATGDESASPAAMIERLVERGKTVVLITHKLRDALKTADRITVMRAGRVITTAPSAEFSLPRLSSLMIGGEDALRETAGDGTAQSRGKLEESASAGEEVLAMEGVSCSEPGFPPLQHLDLSVCSGEVTAVTGIRENGLETLEHLLAGLTNPDSGSVRYLGDEMRSFSSSELRKREIAYIPTERLVRGASMESSVEENMILLNYRDFHSWGRLKKDEIEHYTGRLRREYGIKGSLKQTLSGLSGGNIQKVIISRELERLPKLVIFSEPSWGLDTQSRKFVFEKMDLLARRGSAVLILTSDLDEALEGADTIIPLYRGRSVGRISGGEATRARLGRMILGVERDGVS